MSLSSKTNAVDHTALGRGTLGERPAHARAIVLAGFIAAGFITAGPTGVSAQPAEPAPPVVTGAPTAAPPAVPDTPPAVVTPPPGSDWPCVQRKVETLTAAQMWDGPPVEDIKNWRDDKAIAELVPYLISRRIEMEEVEKAIEKYAQSLPEAERDRKLTQLFAGVLHETNIVRRTVVNGIETFQKRQRLRAHRLEEQGKELAALHDRAKKDKELSDELAELQNHYDWNARVFAERQANMPVACEIPVDIEQRVFAVARAIRNHMSE